MENLMNRRVGDIVKYNGIECRVTSVFSALIGLNFVSNGVYCEVYPMNTELLRRPLQAGDRVKLRDLHDDRIITIAGEEIHLDWSLYIHADGTPIEPTPKPAVEKSSNEGMITGFSGPLTTVEAYAIIGAGGGGCSAAGGSGYARGGAGGGGAWVPPTDAEKIQRDLDHARGALVLAEKERKRLLNELDIKQKAFSRAYQDRCALADKLQPLEDLNKTLLAENAQFRREIDRLTRKK